MRNTVGLKLGKTWKMTILKSLLYGSSDHFYFNYIQKNSFSKIDTNTISKYGIVIIIYYHLNI